MTKSKTIPLHEPCFDLHDATAVLEALRSTWVSTGGPQVERFEREFADFIKVPYAISVCNGTAAIQLILESLKIQLGVQSRFDVIVPTLTFIATASGVIHAGGHPVFVDSVKGGFNLSCDGVECKIHEEYEKSRESDFWLSKASGRPLLAVMPAHIMGWPGEVEKIAELCRNMRIPFLEDAAESLGSFHADGSALGTKGLASAFSFNGNKILTTGGGGMIATHDESFAKLCKHLSTTARTNNLRFEHDRVGHNFRLVGLLAALGCSQLVKLKERLLLKTEILNIYRKNLSQLSNVKIYEESDCIANNWLINLVFDSEALRESALLKLLENGIEARPLWTPLHMQSAFYDHEQYQAAFPWAVRSWKTALSLPSSSHLKASDIDSICQCISMAIQEIP